MSFKTGIGRFFRILVVILPIALSLSACESGQGDSERTAVSKDAVYSKKWEEQKVCWQAEILKDLYFSMGKTTMKMYKEITKGALPFMLVAFALWFCFRLLKHVGSVVEENPQEVWTEVFKKFFLCFVCGLIASSSGTLIYLLNLVVFPMYNAFLEFGSEILAKANTSGVKPVNIIKVFGWSWDIDTEKTWVCKAAAEAKATLEGFPDSPQEMMSCLTCAVSERMNLGFVLSFNILKSGTFMGFIIGVLMLLCFTIVKLGFAFYLVDTIFKMALMTLMLPILIMGFAFKTTQKWLGNGLLIILNSSAFMMFIAVVIAMTLMAVQQIFVTYQDTIFGGNASFKELSVPIMCLLLICFLISSSLGVAKQISSSLVGGDPDDKFQQKVKVLVEGAANFLSWGVTKIWFKMKKKAEGDEEESAMDKVGGAVGKATKIGDLE